MSASGQGPLYRALGVILAACFAIMSISCATTSELNRMERRLNLRIEQVRERAYICAPRELAEAEVAISWSRAQSAQGFGLNARRALVLAEKLLDRAWAISRADWCEGDRDDDGVVDSKDLCPDRPENQDGVDDQDGCPETDRDGDGVADLKDRCPDTTAPGTEDGCPKKDLDKDGIADILDRCPSVRGAVTNQGCPLADDQDSDGIKDDQDKCPTVRGLPELGGCPKIQDKDQDGVPDDTDRCPDQAGAEAASGCPYRHIVIEEDRIVLQQKIFFRRSSSRIDPISFPTLDEIAMALKEKPSLRVQIEGHTDSRGSSRGNRKISKRRASAVRKYLIGRGISADRLSSKGFGEERPISDNDTEEGRSINRRVDFTILSD